MTESQWTRSNNRCDACGAMSYVRVVNEEAHDLEFCAHHFGKFEFGLIEQGFRIDQDHRSLLDNEKQSRLVGSEN